MNSRDSHAPLLRWSIALLLIALLAIACGDDKDDSEGPGLIFFTPTPANAQSICSARFSPAGRVESPELIEISGIAASRRNEDIVWAHNDSGDTARFFAMTTEGATLGSITEGGSVGTFALAGAAAIDWEDMAVGPGPEEGVSYVYLADIGDNDAKRSEIVVYRAPEPTPALDIGTPLNADITEYETLTLRYPDGAHDAEAFLVDPLSGEMLIITKDIASGVSNVWNANESMPSPEVLELVAQINFADLRDQIVVPDGAPPLPNGLRHIPTGGDVSPDGSLVAIRTYGAVFVWERPEGEPLEEAFASEPCLAPSVIEQQGEAIAFNAAGTGYITISEGSNPAINSFVVE